jgi:hypothetical protein
MSAGSQIDYGALAKSYGGQSTATMSIKPPEASNAARYDSLAAEHGGVRTTSPIIGAMDDFISSLDETPNPGNDPKIGARNAVAGFLQGALNLVRHPIDAAVDYGKSAATVLRMGADVNGLPNPSYSMPALKEAQHIIEHPAHDIGSMLGQTAVTAGVAKTLGSTVAAHYLDAAQKAAGKVGTAAKGAATSVASNGANWQTMRAGFMGGMAGRMTGLGYEGGAGAGVALKLMYDAIQGARSALAEKATESAPKSASSLEPAAPAPADPLMKMRDDIAQGYGYKNFEKAPDAAKQTIQNLAKRATAVTHEAPAPVAQPTQPTTPQPAVPSSPSPNFSGPIRPPLAQAPAAPAPEAPLPSPYNEAFAGDKGGIPVPQETAARAQIADRIAQMLHDGGTKSEHLAGIENNQTALKQLQDLARPFSKQGDKYRMSVPDAEGKANTLDAIRDRLKTLEQAKESAPSGSLTAQTTDDQIILNRIAEGMHGGHVTSEKLAAYDPVNPEHARLLDQTAQAFAGPGQSGFRVTPEGYAAIADALKRLENGENLQTTFAPRARAAAANSPEVQSSPSLRKLAEKGLLKEAQSLADLLNQ